jgi:hypothetical protein
MNWQGTTRDRFVYEFDNLMASLRNLAEQASLLSLHIQREADEWELTDRDGCTAMQGMLATPRLIDGLRNILKPITNAIEENKRRKKIVSDALTHLKSTAAGKDLLDELNKNKMGLKLPDGTIIGDKRGRVIEITFKDLPGALGQYDNRKLILNPKYLLSDRTVADTIAHEMQHAIDDKRGLLGGNLALANLSSLIGDKQRAETYIEQELNRVVASEVRAWNRGDSVLQNITYRDDGITTQAEAQAILNKGYEADYERALNDNPFIGGRYRSDVWVDSNGSVQVTLTSKPSLTPVHRRGR